VVEAASYASAQEKSFAADHLLLIYGFVSCIVSFDVLLVWERREKVRTTTRPLA
jgi:hypothetical protein